MAKKALEGNQGRHITGKDFVTAIRNHIALRCTEGKPISAQTAMLWNLLTRAFYIEAYDFKFKAQTGLFLVGIIPIAPKEVIPNTTLLGVFGDLE